MYNKAVVKVMAKALVRFEAKLGRTMTLEEAIVIEGAKIERLQKSDNYRY